MSDSGSVTHWIGRLKAGDRDAARPLWELYFRRLVGLARTKLRNRPLREADEEDAALSAFDSFCRGAALGRFPLLGDRNDLWQLLGLITARKAVDLVTRERRQKRGGGAVQAESALPDLPGSDAAGAGLDGLVGREPTPALAAEVAEECRRLLDLLDDDGLRAVAVRKMEGYTTEEIATDLGCVPRTVERRLRLIRSLWSREVTP